MYMNSVVQFCKIHYLLFIKSILYIHIYGGTHFNWCFEIICNLRKFLSLDLNLCGLNAINLKCPGDSNLQTPFSQNTNSGVPAQRITLFASTCPWPSLSFMVISLKLSLSLSFKIFKTNCASWFTVDICKNKVITCERRVQICNIIHHNCTRG